MTTLRRLCAVTVLSCLLAVTTCAGDMSAGFHNPPPPPASPTIAEPTDLPPDTEVKTDGDPAGDELWETMLTLLQGVFSAF